MKRKSLLLVLALLLTMVTACGNGEQNKSSEAESSDNVTESQNVEISEEDKEKEVEETEKVEENNEELVEFEFPLGSGEELVYISEGNAPLDNIAMKTVIAEEDKSIVFSPADEDGNTGEDYFKFDLENNIFEKYKFVSPMGTGFYYYYNLENNELVKMENMDHEDTTESTKEAGRWESAVEGVESDIEELETYFEEVFGVSIYEVFE